MANAIYANGLARAMENSLLGRERLYRMIDSLSAAEALKILSEVSFGAPLSIESPEDFELLIMSETKRLNDFIRTDCASKEYKAFKLLKNDFHNAEALVKAKYLNIDAENMLVPNGLYDTAALKDKIFADEYKSLNDEMQNALIKIDVLFAEKKATGDVINAIMEKAYYTALYNVSKKDKFLSEFYKLKADTVNVSAALRTRDFALASKMYVSGGNISLEQLRSLCADPVDTLKKKFRFNRQKDLIFSAIEDYEKNSPLSSFEKYSDDYCLNYLNKYKYSNGGIVPFMLYCENKIAEIKNVRIIMVGLINNHSADQIKKRLRVSYVG